MTMRRAPRGFRAGGDDDRSYREAVQHATPQVPITDGVRSAVASLINSARLQAEQWDGAAPAGELDLAAFDQLLDPESEREHRLRLFRTLLVSAIAERRLDGVDLQIVHDESRLRQLWNETCGWGDAVQSLLDDPAITEIKILGTTAIGDGPRGRVALPNAFASAREPLSRAEFLAQSCGVAWSRSSPSVTLPLRSGMRMHITREPRVVAEASGEPGLLIVMRRGRPRPWALADLVERQMLDRPTAGLLALLAHAGCSIVISGQQGAGKTTLLEALVNTRAPETHVVLIEDNANEFRLRPGALATRLRIDDSSASESWRERQEAVRENLRITPDLVVLSEVRGDEAGAVLQQAEAGRATLTTIHADSAEAALHRFARLAAAPIPNNSFAQTPLGALRVLGEAFHAVVHVAYAQRLRRRYVSDVLLLDGIGADGAPVTVPLVTAELDAETIRWRRHAEYAERALAWESSGARTPRRVAARLVDMPDHLTQQLAHDALAQPAPQRIASGDTARDDIVRRARAALRDGAWGEAVAALGGAAPDDSDPTVAALLDQALEAEAIAGPIDRALAEQTALLRQLLADWQLDRARAIVEQTPERALIARRRMRHDGWRLATAAFHRAADAAAAGQRALAEATAQRDAGDLSRALGALRPCDVRLLPPDMGRSVLTARRSLLTQLLARSQSEPGARQQYAAELAQVSEDLGLEPQPAREDARPAAARAGEDRGAGTPPTRAGWLDAALAHSRERARLRQSEQGEP